MIPVYCDLHIHSCLSPCAQDDMTPWNIVGMAHLKGLEVIAITDHNLSRNLSQAFLAGQTYGVGIVGGIEITTREEVHMLGYFPSLALAIGAGEECYAHLPDTKNHPSLFGNQWITGDEDEPIEQVSKLLINATDLSVDDAVALIEKYEGIAIPAHINRGSNGMLGALGMMPPLPTFPVVEVYKALDCPQNAMDGRFVIHSSDAHRLEDLPERSYTLLAKEATAEAVFAQIKRHMNRE